MGGEIALFGVAADDSVAQWDGGVVPPGVMLRWLQPRQLPVPEHGYLLERAPVPEIRTLDWQQHAEAIDGRTDYALPGGPATLGSDQPIRVTSVGGVDHLVVPPGGWLSVRFDEPAWWFQVLGRPAGGGLVLEGLVGGVVKVSEDLRPGSWLEWRTRGLEELRLRGKGLVEAIRYQPLDVPRKWEQIAHLCLPVTDPRYRCAPSGASDEDIAASRVPPAVDWAARYSAGFADLDPVLVALATGDPVPGAGPVVASPSTTTPPPTASIDPAGALDLAALDPHIARAVGWLYDDALAPHGLDGREWAYRVTGTWVGARRVVELTPAGVRAAGVRLRVGGRPPPGWSARPGPGPDGVAVPSTVEVDLGKARLGRAAVRGVTVIATAGRATWVATDSAGGQQSGVWRARQGPLTIRAPGRAALSGFTVSSKTSFRLTGLQIEGATIERGSILPYVLAKPAPPPVGPASLDVTVSAPSGAARALLRWDVSSGVDAFTGGTVSYQTAVTPVASPAAVPAFDVAMLRDDGAAVLVAPATVAAGGPMAIDTDVPEGWRGWWVRGVDLFGRVSGPTGPELAHVVDTTAPPPPALLAAEYAQAGLDSHLALMLGRSSAGDAWLAAHSQSAAIVTFAWTPELDEECPDVDAFRVYARTPAVDGSWVGRPWGSPIALLGAFPVRFDGTITSIDSDLAAVTVVAVEPVDATHARCTTDLAVDVAGSLVGAALDVGGTAYEVVGSGEGAAATIVVGHAAGAPPAVGAAATLREGTSGVRRIPSTVAAPPLSSDPHRARVGGVLVAGAARLLVVAEDAGWVHAARRTGAAWPTVNRPVTWFPAYRVAVADTGFGPRASASHPDAVVQLAVTSVRRSTVQPVESPPSPPATVHAVDVTPPDPPVLLPIPSGERCAQLASAADWHGISRFTFAWGAVAGASGYHVHRAMDDAVRQADMALHGTGPTSVPHTFASLPSDPGRRAAVLADLAAVDASLQAGDAAAARAAYRAMRADAWQLVASQAGVASAFVTLNGVPLAATTTSYEDRFDGVADAHWFYRLSSRNPGGTTSALSPSTPPICAPRTTPPRPPRALLALAADASVRLRFTPSPSAGIARYLVYRTHDRDGAADERDMTEHARLAPDATAVPGPGELVPSPSGGALEWVDANATPGREWWYRIVAEDAAGNRSEPSGVLAARSLFPLPVEPTWVAATRTGTAIHLEWSHPQPRMASKLERRQPGGVWVALGIDWLPRGSYTHDDEPQPLEAAWEYRVVVRDHADHQAPGAPVIAVPAVVTP